MRKSEFVHDGKSDAERKYVSPGHVCPPSSSSNTNGNIVFLHVTVLTCSRWTEVSGHFFFCNVVVQGIFERLIDLFLPVAWTTVRRDAPRALVCQREMRDVTVTIVADIVWKIPRYVEAEQHHRDRARAAARAECAGANNQKRAHVGYQGNPLLWGRCAGGPLPKGSEQR